MQFAISIASLDIEETVSKYSRDCIFALFQKMSDLIDIVVDSLAVFTPKRSELTVTDFLAVDRQFVVSETADIEIASVIFLGMVASLLRMMLFVESVSTSRHLA